jgi:electron transfer flavoprotein alpha/beta subunit
VDATPKVKVQKLAPPPKREAGKKVESVEELMDLLHTEAKVV